MNCRAFIAALVMAFSLIPRSSATLSGAVPELSRADARADVIARARVWIPTDIANKDLKRGPAGEGAFPFHATVTCRYVDKTLSGNSPKFACLLGGHDEVKVKFGGANGEVYGEVLATRLLWALGFGADRMYPVNVICQGCPPDLGGIERPNHESRFDPAVIERRYPGGEWPPDGPPGWSWDELDRIEVRAGGAPRSQRDALKLLAVFLQHTDSKPEQQRIVCASTPSSSRGACDGPLLMISDLGLTFGRANRTNANSIGGVNLVAWRETALWKSDRGCIGNLPKSLTGTLGDPIISEAGRSFLASLLVQLSDRQIHDLFEVARVQLRLRAPEDVSSGFAGIEEWVQAFTAKRRQIVERRC